MFIITYNDNVILGPMKWNARRFTEVIEEDCEITITLPLTNEPERYYEVNQDIKIWPVQSTVNPDYNIKTEFLNGPFYEYVDGVAYSSMVVSQLPLIAAQNFAKRDVSISRWKKQNSGVQVTLNGIEYTFVTDLQTKSTFHQYITSNLESINWKIDQDTWIVLSKSDIQTVFNSIVNHIQSAFDWELEKYSEIIETTHETLSEINLE
jgi:hypothetical protein